MTEKRWRKTAITVVLEPLELKILTAKANEIGVSISRFVRERLGLKEPGTFVLAKKILPEKAIVSVLAIKSPLEEGAVAALAPAPSPPIFYELAPPEILKGTGRAKPILWDSGVEPCEKILKKLKKLTADQGLIDWWLAVRKASSD